jgi:hypothetical protein
LDLLPQRAAARAAMREMVGAVLTRVSASRYHLTSLQLVAVALEASRWGDADAADLAESELLTRFAPIEDSKNPVSTGASTLRVADAFAAAEILAYAASSAAAVDEPAVPSKLYEAALTALAESDRAVWGAEVTAALHRSLEPFRRRYSSTARENSAAGVCVRSWAVCQI